MAPCQDGRTYTGSAPRPFVSSQVPWHVQSGIASRARCRPQLLASSSRRFSSRLAPCNHEGSGGGHTPPLPPCGACFSACNHVRTSSRHPCRRASLRMGWGQPVIPLGHSFAGGGAARTTWGSRARALITCIPFRFARPARPVCCQVRRCPPACSTLVMFPRIVPISGLAMPVTVAAANVFTGSMANGRRLRELSYLGSSHVVVRAAKRARCFDDVCAWHWAGEPAGVSRRFRLS